MKKNKDFLLHLQYCYKCGSYFPSFGWDRLVNAILRRKPLCNSCKKGRKVLASPPIGMGGFDGLE